MRDGFIKAAAVTPKVKVADVAFNKEQILLEMKRAAEDGAAVIPGTVYYRLQLQGPVPAGEPSAGGGSGIA